MELGRLLVYDYMCTYVPTYNRPKYTQTSFLICETFKNSVNKCKVIFSNKLSAPKLGNFLLKSVNCSKSFGAWSY